NGKVIIFSQKAIVSPCGQSAKTRTQRTSIAGRRRMRLLCSKPMPAAPRPMPAPALLADIGGTQARFALTGPGATPTLLDGSLRSYPVERFDTLAAAARQYLDEVGAAPRRAV